MDTKEKKDIEVLIKVPHDWLSAHDLDFLSLLSRTSSQSVERAVKEQAIAKIMAEIELPSIKIEASEVKDRILTLLAQKALDKEDYYG